LAIGVCCHISGDYGSGGEEIEAKEKDGKGMCEGKER